MSIYYSKTTRGFYSEDIHGARQIEVADPAWTATQIEVPNPDVEGETILVDDPANPPTFITINNPACLIPLDSLAVSDEHHAELIDAQSLGKVIESDEQGYPVANDPPPPSNSEIAARARLTRDRMLTVCDWVVTRSYETGTPVPSDWVQYREGLRNVPEQIGFPATINWPVVPE